ncbi:MAG: hypothetical protein WCP86_09445 [bacterium]
MKKAPAIVLLLALSLVACLWFLVKLQLDHARERAFDALQRGTPQAFVVKTSGAPSEADGPPLYVAWVESCKIAR